MVSAPEQATTFTDEKGIFRGLLVPQDGTVPYKSIIEPTGKIPRNEDEVIAAMIEVQTKAIETLARTIGQEVAELAPGMMRLVIDYDALSARGDKLSVRGVGKLAKFVPITGHQSIASPIELQRENRGFLDGITEVLLSTVAQQLMNGKKIVIVDKS